MLPQFPLFKKIELTDRADVEAHTNLYEPYSDFNFTCLWAWDTREERMISELNGNLVVKFTDYHTHNPFVSFLGSNDCEDTARMLTDYCEANDLPTTLRLMPDVSIQGLDPAKFIIEESRGDFDYILSAQKLTLLAGKEFQDKRKKRNRFWRENLSARHEQIQLSDSVVQTKIFELIKVWKNHKIVMKKNYELAHEMAAIKRLFNSDYLDSLFGFGIFLGDVMLGYYIGEKTISGWSMDHFAKSTISYKGINEALIQGYAKYLNSLQIKYMNVESDLDFEELRRSKTSWRPVKFLKRYNVTYSQF